MALAFGLESMAWNDHGLLLPDTACTCEEGLFQR